MVICSSKKVSLLRMKMVMCLELETKKKNKLLLFESSNYTSFTECKMFRMWELIEDFNQFYNGICEINFSNKLYGK